MGIESQPAYEPAPGELERMLVIVFPSEGLRDAARSQLLRYGMDSSNLGVARIRLAILKLSGGDLLKLDKMVDLAQTDYRDVLAAAEYPAYTALPRQATQAETRAAIESDRRQHQQWLDRP